MVLAVLLGTTPVRWMRVPVGPGLQVPAWCLMDGLSFHPTPERS